MQPLSSRKRSNQSGLPSAQWIFLGGAVITSAFYLAIAFPAFRTAWIDRLFLGHPAKPMLSCLFFWGMTALAWRSYRAFRELRALVRKDLDHIAKGIGNIAEVAKLFGPGGATARELGDGRLGQRIATAIAHGQRGASDELGHRLELLAERDARELESSYEWLRTLCRVIPVLGFLGTLISASVAVSGTTGSSGPEVMRDLILAVSSAVGTTALALLLWIPLVLAKALVFRLENMSLTRIDMAARAILGNWVTSRAPESRAFLGVVNGVSRIILQATRDAWREQGQLWSRTVEQVGEAQIAALHAAVEKFVEQVAQVVANQAAQFEQFLGGLENLRQLSQQSLAEVAAKMTAHQMAAKRQVELLGVLIGEEGRLTNLQRSLNENLVTLANVQALDQAIHSLTAAAHLLTTRAGRAYTDPRAMHGDESKRGVAA